MVQTPSVHLHVGGLHECSILLHYSSCWLTVYCVDGPVETPAEGQAESSADGSDGSPDGSSDGGLAEHPANSPSYSPEETPAVSPVVSPAVSPVVDVQQKGTVAQPLRLAVPLYWLILLSWPLKNLRAVVCLLVYAHY